MNARLSPLPDEDLRAEARAILDRLPPEALGPVTEFLRSFEIRPEQSEAETLNRFFVSLCAELHKATENVRAARAGLNELAAQLTPPGEEHLHSLSHQHEDGNHSWMIRSGRKTN
jgi:hypothetical protein